MYLSLNHKYLRSKLYEFTLNQTLPGFQIFFSMDMLSARVETLLEESSKAKRLSIHDCLDKEKNPSV